MVGIDSIATVILQPARVTCNERRGIETNRSRTIDEQIIREDLVRRPPERQVVDWDFHWHARRHGGRIGWYVRIGLSDFLHRGIESSRQRRKCITRLGNIIDQFSGVELRAGGLRGRRRAGGLGRFFKGGSQAPVLWQAGCQGEGDDKQDIVFRIEHGD